MDNLAEQRNPSITHRNTMRDFLRIIFKRFWIFLILPLIVVGIIFAVDNFVPPVYEASTELKINDSDLQNMGITGVERNSGTVFRTKNEQINSEIAIVSSTLVLQQVAIKLKLWEVWELDGNTEEDKTNAATNILAGNLDVSPLLDSWVIKVSYKDKDPELAAQITNEIATEYITQSIAFNNLPQAAEFYKDKLDKEHEELITLQEEFRVLRQQSDVVDYDAEIRQVLTNRASFEQRLTEVEKSILTKRSKISRTQEFLSENPDFLIPIPEIATVRVVEDLNYRLVNLQLELDSLLQRYTEEERSVRLTKAQITEVQDQIKQEVKKIVMQDQTELKRLITERASLKTSIRQINVTLQNKSLVEPSYTGLAAQIKNKQEIISDLNKKYTNTLYAGQSDSRLGYVKQTNPAITPAVPVWPNLRLNLMIGIPLALLFGLALVMMMEYFDRSFSTPERVEQVLNIPVIASINQVDLKKEPLFK